MKNTVNIKKIKKPALSGLAAISIVLFWTSPPSLINLVT
jgi:hypothetical protein